MHDIAVLDEALYEPVIPISKNLNKLGVYYDDKYRDIGNTMGIIIQIISDYRDELLWILEVDDYPKEVVYNCLWALDECQEAIFKVNEVPWEEIHTPYMNLVRLMNEFNEARLNSDRPICNRDGPIVDSNGRTYMMFANALNIIEQVVYDLSFICDPEYLI